MAEALRHQCTSCGGDLILDSEAKLYKCPFCGVTYDYDLFGEEDALSRGMNALRRGEFNSAKEAFDQVLGQEPQDFLALRGRMLAKARMKSIRDFENHGRLAMRNYGVIHIEEELEAAGSTDKEYFERLRDMFKLCEEYAQAQKKMREAQDNKRKINAGEVDYEIETAAALGSGYNTPDFKLSLVVISAIAIGGILALVNSAEKNSGELWTGALALAVVIAIPIISIVATNRKDADTFASELTRVNNERERRIRQQEDQITKYREESCVLIDKINKAYAVIREDDPETRTHWKIDMP
ncbi:MAG: hypothetical protein K6F45_05845 [Saccharofermentans sp.]|nr:hypothetical protein [Saccharofermentans sp.]